MACDLDGRRVAGTRGIGAGDGWGGAELLARDMGRKLEYAWWAQRRGFLRHTIKAGLCDVVMGVPASLDMLETTRPYYRSTYMFVTRRDSRIDIESLDDPLLKSLRVGVQ